MTENVGVPFLEGRYSPTLDLWPIEAKEFNRIHTFYDNLKAGKYTTTKCKGCGHISYPPRVICPECYSDDLEWIELPTKGKVITFVEKSIAIPIGFGEPLIDAWIDLGKDSPVRHVFSRVINCESGGIKEGDEVQFVVFDVPGHPIEMRKEKWIAKRVYFAFEPVK